MIRIRAATVADARGIAEVHVASWRESYAGIVPDEYLAALAVEERERRWVSGLDDPDNPSFVYVAEDESRRIVGFASGGPRHDGDAVYAGELYAIYLLRVWQGQGVGRRLVAAVARTLAERDMRSMLLWVFAENPARRFYEALGGQYLAEQQFELGGRMLTEVGYGWLNTSALYDEGNR